MGFGRFRELFRREPTRQELYLRLARGLNIERDYQTWIESWEDYGPARPAATPLTIALAGDGSAEDHAYWRRMAAENTGLHVIQTFELNRNQRMKGVLPEITRVAIADHFVILLPSDRLAASAQRRLGAAIEARPEAAVIFGDEDQISGGRRFAPWFKPDFGEDLFLCQSGFGRAVFFRKAALAGLELAETTDLDAAVHGLALQVTAAMGRDPLHCPGILVHVAGHPEFKPKARVLYESGAARSKAVEDFIARRPSLAGATVEGPDQRGNLRLRH